MLEFRASSTERGASEGIETDVEEEEAVCMAMYVKRRRRREEGREVDGLG